MANDNQIDFKVRLQREGVSELAGDLKNIDESAKDLAQAATAAGAGVDRLESASKDAGDAVSALARMPSRLRMLLRNWLRQRTLQTTRRVGLALDQRLRPMASKG